MSFTATAAGGTRASSQFTSSSGTGGRRAVTAECQHEKAVRRNIQQIRTNLQSTEEHLENLSRRLVSRRIFETLHERLKETYQIVLDTEGIFAEWEAQLAGHPFEKHKRKFSFEKLKAHFEAEVDRVKDVSQRVQSVATKVAHQASASSPVSTATTGDRYDGRRAGRICGGTGGSSGDFVTGVIDYDDDFTVDGGGGGGSSGCDGGGGRSDVLLRDHGGGEEEDADIVLLDDPTSISTNHRTATSTAATEATLKGRMKDTTTSNARGGGGIDRWASVGGVSRKEMVDSADAAAAAWQPLPCVATAGVAGRNHWHQQQQESMSELDESTEHDSLLQRSVANDRLRGIKKIEHQVAQANQIFRDLASLVVSQDPQLDSLDSSLQKANSHTKGASLELQKAYALQRTSRRRRLFLLFFACILLVVVFYILRIPSPHFLHRKPTQADRQHRG
eukprot:GHVS01069676.1.p1 GENE.GHVS01069676.1~~GHVS01069676.1.p1  ORF type:complete len:448 (+),score=105.69 GHVS01069676.1:178-1521(+)